MPMLRKEYGYKDNYCCYYYGHFLSLSSIVITATESRTSMRADIAPANCRERAFIFNNQKCPAYIRPGLINTVPAPGRTWRDPGIVCDPARPGEGAASPIWRG